MEHTRQIHILKLEAKLFDRCECLYDVAAAVSYRHDGSLRLRTQAGAMTAAKKLCHMAEINLDHSIVHPRTLLGRLSIDLRDRLPPVCSYPTPSKPSLPLHNARTGKARTPTLIISVVDP